MSRDMFKEAVSYIEKAGACAALLIGSVTVMRFSSKVFPPAPALGIVVGTILFILAFCLAVWLAITTAASLFKGPRGRVITFIIAVVLLLVTVFFITASAYAAIAAFG